MAFPTVSSPTANATVHSQFTVTGGVSPAEATIVNVLIVSANGNNSAFGSTTSAGDGSWSVPFTVNPDNYTGSTTLRVWLAENGVDRGFNITA